MTRMAVAGFAGMLLYIAATEFSSLLALCSFALLVASLMLTDSSLKKLIQKVALHLSFAFLAPTQYAAYSAYRRGQWWASLLDA